MRNNSDFRFLASDFRFLISGFCLLISGCGFSPMYGVNRDMPVGVETKLQQVEIANIPDREGQYLRNQLIDRFYRDGYPSAPAYTLSVGKLAERITKLDVTKTSDATRAQLKMQARMTLQDRGGAKILERELRAVTSYNILGSEFTNRVAEDNARLNALNDLARQAEMQLNLYFKSER